LIDEPDLQYVAAYYCKASIFPRAFIRYVFQLLRKSVGVLGKKFEGHFINKESEPKSKEAT